MRSVSIRQPFMWDLARVSSRSSLDCERLFWGDRGQFHAGMEEAFGRGLTSYLAFGLTAQRNGVLQPQKRTRLIRALIESKAFAGAMAVMAEDDGGEDTPPDWERLRARCEAGLGLFRRAADRLETLATISPDDREITDDLAAVRATLAAEAEVEATDFVAWPKVATFVTHCLHLGAWRRAIRAVAAFNSSGQKLEKEQRDDFTNAIVALLHQSSPQEALQLLASSIRVQRAPDAIEADNAVKAILGLAPGEETPDAWAGKRVAAAAFAAVGRRDIAIRRLGDLTRTLHGARDSGDVMGGLSRFVSQSVVEAHPWPARVSGARKIIDVFPFNDERMMLHLKLGEMSPWVDNFVLVESDRTFTGAPKPLWFERWKDEFAAYADKIVHVKVESYPEWADSAWAREFYQRDMARQALAEICHDDDLVLITDTDEILERKAVDRVRDYAVLLQERSRYFLNYRQKLSRGEQRGLVTAWRGRYVRELGLSYLRTLAPRFKEIPKFYNAGWHFTSIADPEGIDRKYEATSHQEFVRPGIGALHDLLDKIRKGEAEPGWEVVPLDERFPAFLRDNHAMIADFLAPTPSGQG